MTLNTKMKDGSEAECFGEVWSFGRSTRQNQKPMGASFTEFSLGSETVAIFKIKLKPKK